MTALDRLAEALLRLAARRWPASVREVQLQEWSAELHALRTEPGAGAGRRAFGQLRFAFSLAAAAPVDDEDGVPRGWRDALPAAGRALQPFAVLVFFGLIAIGPAAGVLRAVNEWLLGLAGVKIGWPSGATITALTSVPALLVLTIVAWWLGRRMPLGLPRLGRAGSAAAAPLPLALAFAVLVVGTQSSIGIDGETFAVCLVIGAPVWAALTAALAAAVARLTSTRRRWWPVAVLLALVGTPLVVELAVTAAVLPSIAASGADLSAAFAWAPDLVSGAVLGGGADSWYQSHGAISLFNATNAYPVHLLILTGVALGYGVGAAHPRPPRPAPVPVPTTAPMRLRPSTVTAGVVALLVGLISWAYTLTVLTPAMPRVGETAPMPGGDGELYMWVAELRWGGVTLAALGLLLATADRRAGPLAAAMQTVALLVTDGVLARTESPTLRTALTAGAITATVAWAVAGPTLGRDGLAARRRLAWTAVIAACCGPIMLGQGTPAVNHPFLPTGLSVTTALVAAGLALVAARSAAAARPVPLHPTWSAAVTAAPVLLLGALGLTTGAGVPSDITITGLLLSAPMLLTVIAVMRTRRPAGGWARPTLWTVLVLTSPVLSFLLVAASLLLSMFAANVLFTVAGSSWAADGMSLLPGAVILTLTIGVLTARKLIRTPEPPPGHPALPAPHPTPPPGQPAVPPHAPALHPPALNRPSPQLPVLHPPSLQPAPPAGRPAARL
ncbi:hypothetical protein GCM10009827_047590 [Dactylosporangium maewongense]|uniref:Integral membrane protein n=1 Tax=Dactylosporangium maewongense TaxID=634393 RepID=A0ABN2ATC5_9ACTN